VTGTSAGQRVVGAVLAAGSGSRLGAPKADLVLGGQRLVDRAVTALAGGGCSDVVVVGRAGSSVTGVRVVVNPDPDAGMRSSLALAVEVAEHAGAEVLLVVLVDMPDIDMADVRAVLENWRPGRISTASYAGTTAPPTAMDPAMWRRALDAAGPDEGARAFVAAHPDLVDVVAVGGTGIDIDTADDLSGWGRH
jgi:molybdenum cofactor cytidylyltransferase/nicotine blue oxidoreductase